MLIETAKETVIAAGKKLIESGLIARTWGNISCRIDDKQFAITPSGRDYKTLTTDDIVIVNIDDLSYTGDIKPSSEKGIHADVYKYRSDVNFVIHTHQLNASVLSAIKNSLNIKENVNKKLIGENVLCADYGLPGTKKLRKGVVKVLEKYNSNAIILANHGAICMGKVYEEAFDIAYELERECDNYIQTSKTVTPSVKALNLTDKELTKITKSIVNYRQDINNVIFSNDEDIVKVSSLSTKIKPLLDDFAQIAGVSLKTVKYDKINDNASIQEILLALRGRNVVLLKGYGALCCGQNESDAQAVQIVTKKQCKAFMFARNQKQLHYINPIECLLMRYIYLKNYSKKING